jgi:hypothetical protein
MLRLHVALVLLVLVGSAACASTPVRAVRSEFEDIPLPKGLTYVEERSTIIESPSVKAARLIYRGPIEMSSLAAAVRTNLEANGWRNVSANSSGEHGVTQVYEKAGNSLQVRLWDGFYFRPVTYVELTASRALQSPK